MGLFAEIQHKTVVNIIHGKLNFVKRLPGKYIEITKENTKHKNDVGIGYNYDPVINEFYPPKPYKGWILDSKFKWQPPIPKPTDVVFMKKDYIWNENQLKWDAYDITETAGKLTYKKQKIK